MRCAGIHDPRVGHDEAHSRKLIKVDRLLFPQHTLFDTDAHIDYLHMTKISETIYGGPFGSQTAEILSSYKALSAAICNSDARPAVLTQSQRIEIALAMAKTRPVAFEFKNSHTIYENHLCMWRQFKVFDTARGQVQEIPGEAGKALIRRKAPGVISVSEIAFDQEVREGGKLHPPALWFNIPLQAIEDIDMKRIKELNSIKGQVSFALSHHDPDPPFRVFYPREAFYPGGENNDSTVREFMTDILRHELSELQNTNVLSSQRTALEGRFEAIKRVLAVDQWPASKGTENRNAGDAVPGVEDRYSASLMEDKQRLWEEFATAPWGDRSPSNSLDGSSKGRSRLCSFVALSEGQSLPEDAISTSSRCQLPFVADVHSSSFWYTWTKEWGTVIDQNRIKGNRFE